MTPAPISVERLRELLAEIVGDYKVCLGVSKAAYDDYCRRGAVGRLPNQSWGLHCRRRIDELEALPALLQQLAEREAECERLEEELTKAADECAKHDISSARLMGALSGWQERAYRAERARDEAFSKLREIAEYKGDPATPIKNSVKKSAIARAFLAASGGE